MTATDTRHAFDATLGGIGPYRLLGVMDNEGGNSRCDHCGTPIRWVFIVTDSAAERRWAVGSDCIAKVDTRLGEAARSEKARHLREVEAKARQEQYEREVEEAFLRVRDEYSVEAWEALTKGRHRILLDLASKLRERRGLSEKQLALAVKLWREEVSPTPKGTAPTGRVVVEGEVASLKWHHGAYGSTLKATLKCADSVGEYRVWLSVPAAVEWEVGQRVRVKVTLEPGDSPDFAFGKRPALV